MLEFIWQTFVALKFEYLEQFLTALVPMSATVMIHGKGMQLAGRHFKRFGAPAAGRHFSNMVVAIVVVAIMLATHFAEVAGWAIFYLATGMVAEFQAAMAFSISSYTTLGSSTIQLPGRWHGFEGFEAMTAMLMFGWSTAMLAAIVQKSFNVLDDQQPR
jgi:voltage-gated potassium channel